VIGRRESDQTDRGRERIVLYLIREPYRIIMGTRETVGVESAAGTVCTCISKSSTDGLYLQIGSNVPRRVSIVRITYLVEVDLMILIIVRRVAHGPVYFSHVLDGQFNLHHITSNHTSLSSRFLSLRASPPLSSPLLTSLLTSSTPSSPDVTLVIYLYL
jgi:molybdopterin-binding protein